jgi:hypothetical protein
LDSNINVALDIEELDISMEDLFNKNHLREKTLFNTLNTEILSFFQIQLYNKEKTNTPRITKLLKLNDTDGPSTGNLNPYNKMLIPSVKHKAANGIINKLLFKYLSPKPKLMPNNPVVKRNTNTSLGWIMANRKMVTK